jgi:hypothetical protein
VPGSTTGPSGGKDAAAAAAGVGGHVQCEVPRELELLKGVSGFAVPGKLMALMGGSGAGESLLVCQYVISIVCCHCPSHG